VVSIGWVGCSGEYRFCYYAWSVVVVCKTGSDNFSLIWDKEKEVYY
jgi:hypothetical protein